MKRLYIHLGTGKTGSTAIQRFLDHNDEALSSTEGIDYVKTARRNLNHHALCTNFHRNKGGVASDVNPHIDELLEEIEGSSNESFVFSSEYFPSVTSEEIGNYYVDRLSSIVDIHVIVYLRRQDEFVESWYTQLLKAGQPGAAEGIDRLYSRLSRDGVLDYQALVDSWAQYVGHENVHVRPFERDQFLGGNIVHDFMSVLDVKNLNDYVIPEGDPNPSLSRDQARIIESFHRAGMEKRLDNHLRRPFDLKSEHSRYVMSPARRQEVIDDWRAVNAEVAQIYMGRQDGDLFRAEEPLARGDEEDDFSYPSPEFMFRTVQHMIDRETVRLRREISSLREELNERSSGE